MPTDIEQGYVDQGYRLPEGLTWEQVAASRKRWGVNAVFVPLACGPGCVGRGVPFVDGRPLKHP